MQDPWKAKGRMRPTLIEFPVRGDARGSLVAIEREKDIPFPIRRVYYVFDTRAGVRRGCHAHLRGREMAVCVSGHCTFLLDDGRTRTEVVLDSRNRGLVIEPMIWHEIFDFSRDCVLVVLASELYDESDYIRRYEDFLGERR